MKRLFTALVCALLTGASLTMFGAQPPPVYAPALAPLAASGVKVSAAAAPDGGDALVFDGKSEGGVKLAVPESVKKALKDGEVSASFWFRMDRPSEADMAFGFYTCKRYYDSAPFQFKLKTMPTDFGVYEATSIIEHRVVFGVWHHAAFSFSLSNLTFTTYFDGQVEAIRRIATDMPSPINLNDLFKPIGARRFAGAIASLRVWDHALERDELNSFKPSQNEASRLEKAFRDAAGSKHKAFGAALETVADDLRAKAAGPCSIREWQTASRVARDLPVLSEWANAAAASGTIADAPFTASTFYAYDYRKHLPFELPEEAEPATSLSMYLAKGEFEGKTFMLHPVRDVRKLDISAEPLVCGGKQLPPEALDIRVVKCWYNPIAGWNTYYSGGRENPMLAPELLMHDDSLVVVDTDARANLLRVDYASGSRYVNISDAGSSGNKPTFNYVTSPVADTKGPMPVNVSMRFGEGRQFWITVHAPSDAASGTYTTKITFTADGKPAGFIPLSVEIRPYELPLARTRYDTSLEYLGGMMNHCGLSHQVAMGHSLEVAEKRFFAEMKNMAEHNIRHPFVGGFSESDKVGDLIAERQFDLLRHAGCSGEFAFGGGSAVSIEWASDDEVSPEKNPEVYEKYERNFDKQMQYAAKRFDEVLGHRNVTFFGMDEAGPGTVRKEFRFFAIVQKYGFPIFLTSGVAAYANFIVDVDDIPSSINDSDVARWHAAGARAVSYASPFTGPENPEAWRRYKGLRMYLANYDGLAEYVWYEGYNIWNEFVSTDRYKNFNIVYPTSDGVLDTVAWESMREGYDDIRYATLLKLLGDAAMKSPDAKVSALGRESVFWLDMVDAETIDLDDYRAEAANRIARMLDAGVAIPPPPKPIGKRPPPLRPTAEVFSKPDSELGTFDALVAEAARLRKAGFHDLARPLLRRAADFPGADEAAKTKALLDLADSSRLLLDDAEAAKIFRALVEGPKTAPDVRAKAYAGLMRTIVAPAEYEWSPTPEALDRAQALYDAAFAERRLTPKDKAGLIEIIKTPFIHGGRAEKLIVLCEEWIKPGAAFHKEGLAAMLYEAQGDAYAALHQYAKAVSRYNRVNLGPYNKYRVLEKTGENARRAKDFRKAQQAYSDLIALVDKEESKSTYNRLSRIIVSLTKATQNATKAEAAAVLETGEFSDLSLDE